MTKLIHSYSGKSLLELREQYGTGSSGFYNNDWWLNKPFVKEKAEPGEYEIVLDKKFVDLTYDEQVKKIGKGFDVAHPAVIVEFILEHYKKTGERLLEDWWVRTNLRASDGSRVCLGSFDAHGLYVYNYWDDDRHDFVGLSVARKFLSSRKLEPIEDLTLEQAIKIVKDNNYKIFKEV